MGAASARPLIGESGPLRRIEVRCHLTRQRTQILVALLITWVPIMALGLASEHLTGRTVRLLHDNTMHVRLLVATPLLLFLDRVFPSACTHVVDRLARDAFIKVDDRPRFERLVDRIRRLCGWWLPEATIVLLALSAGSATLFATTPGHGLVLRGAPTAADWWYGLVAFPMFEFLLFRSLWRWAIWVGFLVGLSRFDLDLDATHPDRRGGIAFLRKPSLAYCALVLFAISAVLSAGWLERFQLGTLASFVPLLLLFAAVAILVAFGPLLLFALPLQRARFAARDALGGLAVRNGRWFRDLRMKTAGGEALANDEAQGLAAIASLYRETVHQMSLALFEKKDLLLVLLATLAPVLPTMLARIPHDEWMALASFLVSKGGSP